jgi:hypothetical protein
MHIVKKLSLSLISLLFYIIVPTLILLSVFQSALFEEKIISNSMEKVGLFEKTSEQLTNDFSVSKEDFVNEDSEAYANAQVKQKIDEKAEQYVSIINSILDESITTTWVQQKFIGLEDELLLAIKGERDFDFTLDISDLKNTILVKFDAAFTEEQKNEQFHQEVRASLADLPTELDVQETGMNLNSLESLQTYQAEYEQNNVIVSGVMIFLLIIGAIIAYTSGTLFRWTGTTMTSTGISVTFYFAAMKFFPAILEKLSIQIPDAAGLTSEKIESVITYLTSELASKLLPYAISITVVGFILIALSFVPALNKKNISEQKAA